jgi:Flp pilus assembly protein CpaB
VRRRRGRAIAFASAAAVCAGLAAAATQPPSGDLAAQGGELRDVLVARRPLQAHQPIRPAELEGSVDVRRVPERFVPPDVLSSPDQAVGRMPAVAIPGGSYLLASEFAAPVDRSGPRPRAPDPGHRPVEITITGAGALSASGSGPRRVDVVVTTEPGPGGGAGRTYVAAAGVELLDLRPVDDAPDGDVVGGSTADSFVATLALTRRQALRLIQAESFARAVSLLQR